MAAADVGDVSSSYGFQEYAFNCVLFITLSSIITTMVSCNTCHLWVRPFAGGACSMGKLDDLRYLLLHLLKEVREGRVRVRVGRVKEDEGERERGKLVLDNLLCHFVCCSLYC